MSTDDQRYSTTNQSAAIALYAAAHNIGIVRSFVDEGKSGTTIKGRAALQELLRTVESGTADFDLVLAYDVSRWGRFPDSDEAAHYEFLCKKAGIGVRYCAEQFEDDNSMTSNLLKAVKRTMAADYSRELGARVFAGQRRIASLGWWHGGPAPFGFVRRLVGEDGRRKQILKPGQRKYIQTDRTTLALGPRKAVATIKLAFDLLTKKGKAREEILDHLNGRGFLFCGHAWTHRALSSVLRNPVYKGANAFGRSEWKVTKSHKRNPTEKWIVCEGAFPRIVSLEQFARAQELIGQRVSHRTKAEMLEALHNLWKREGTLCCRIIDAAIDVPNRKTLTKHFGSLSAAYELIGFDHGDTHFSDAKRRTKGILEKLCEEICDRIRAVGATAARGPEPGSLVINGNLSAKVVRTFLQTRGEHQGKWALSIFLRRRHDILIIARLDAAQHSILDYYVVPALAELRGRFYFREERNAAFLDLYHMKTLDPLAQSLRRRRQSLCGGMAVSFAVAGGDHGTALLRCRLWLLGWVNPTCGIGEELPPGAHTPHRHRHGRLQRAPILDSRTGDNVHTWRAVFQMLSFHQAGGFREGRSPIRRGGR
jgi:DNA invertase Pin-like site-specific DNA recombinase